MNRLFLRIYLTVAVATLAVVAAVTVLGASGLLGFGNAEVAEHAAPGLRAAAARIDGGASPEAVLGELAATVGPTLALLPIDLAPLDDDDRAALRAGDVVVVGSPLRREAYVWVASRDAALELEVAGFDAGPLFWMGLPETATLGRTLSASELDLTPVDAERLKWRPIRYEDGVLRYEDGAYVYIDGGFGEFDPRFWFLALTLFALAVATGVSLRPVARQLVDLSTTAQKFGDGDLGARVQITGRSPVEDVSQQFNAMADRVRTVIADNEQLLRSVSHEMRTPVGRLLFSLDLLESEDDPDARTALTGQLRDTAMEMRALTQELLQYHRLGTTAPDVERHPVDLAELVDDVAVRWEGTVVERDDAAAMVSGDAQLLFRAVDNLVANAVRYASPPTVRLVREEEHWHILVDDDGDGFPEQDRQRVFEPFVRLEGSRSRDTGGTGLGLAIVRRIARGHGGDCVIEASPLGGARMRFTVRAVDSGPSARPGSASQAATSP